LSRVVVKASVVLAAVLLSAAVGAVTRFEVPFGVEVSGIENRYSTFAVFTRPNRLLDVKLIDLAGSDAQILFDGVPISAAGQTVNVRMPETPGTHSLQISNGAGEAMQLNVFVMWVKDDNAFGMLNGYRIGDYPGERFKGLAIYDPPSAFVEVTRENADTPVSPNFTLGQFVCKQGSGYPKYLVLRPELVQKLEVVLGELSAVNPAVTGLTVMSGYRTPAYNKGIGNGQYSRHVWGGAADVYVDEDGNGVMDDLNGDGRVSRADSTWLAGFVDGLERKDAFGDLIGGIGTYDSTPSHGPFVHVDARGYTARW